MAVEAVDVAAATADQWAAVAAVADRSGVCPTPDANMH